MVEVFPQTCTAVLRLTELGYCADFISEGNHPALRKHASLITKMSLGIFKKLTELPVGRFKTSVWAESRDVNSGGLRWKFKMQTVIFINTESRLKWLFWSDCNASYKHFMSGLWWNTICPPRFHFLLTLEISYSELSLSSYPSFCRWRTSTCLVQSSFSSNLMTVRLYLAYLFCTSFNIW